MNERTCPRCGRPMKPAANECPSCGSKTATANSGPSPEPRDSSARVGLYAGVAVSVLGAITILTAEIWNSLMTGIILALIGGVVTAVSLFRLDRQKGWRRVARVGQIAGAAIMMLGLRCFQDTGSGLDANTVAVLFGVGNELIGAFVLAISSLGVWLSRPKPSSASGVNT